MKFNKFVQINNRNLLMAIKEGVHPMQVLFKPSPIGPLPYCFNLMSPKHGNAKFTVGNHIYLSAIAHIAGRWLDALLNAENTVGIDVDEEVIQNLQKLAFATLTEGVPGLPCGYDANYQVNREFDTHSLRESMHSLVALAQYRNSKEAIRIAKLQIGIMMRYYDFDKGYFAKDLFSQEQNATIKKTGRLHFAESFGRYIGPLVKMYLATGLEEALLLAIKLKDTCFKYILKEDGHFDPELFGYHLHSTTSMISSAKVVVVTGTIPVSLSFALTCAIGNCSGWAIAKSKYSNPISFAFSITHKSLSVKFSVQMNVSTPNLNSIDFSFLILFLRIIIYQPYCSVDIRYLILVILHLYAFLLYLLYRV